MFFRLSNQGKASSLKGIFSKIYHPKLPLMGTKVNLRTNLQDNVQDQNVHVSTIEFMVKSSWSLFAGISK